MSNQKEPKEMHEKIYWSKHLTYTSFFQIRETSLQVEMEVKEHGHIIERALKLAEMRCLVLDLKDIKCCSRQQGKDGFFYRIPQLVIKCFLNVNT